MGSCKALFGTEHKEEHDLNKLSKVLTAVSAVLTMTVPVLAGDSLDSIVGADFGGFGSLLMATLLLVFGFFMQKNFWK